MEVHDVQVNLEGGNSFITPINGTPGEILEYYRIGSQLNMGIDGDLMVTIKSVTFLS